ncbi:MAG: O-antigen ligase family protein, partial [Candidatus Promineifilaceae bacterium]
MKNNIRATSQPEGGNRYRAAMGLETAAHLSFAFFFFLALTTPSWRYGPFSWLPLFQFTELAGGPVRLGVLNLLPGVAAICWLGGRFLSWPKNSSPWQWGTRHITWPLFGLTLLGVVSLIPAAPRLQFIEIGGLLLAWLVYLFVINERPNLQPALAAVVLVQGVTAVGQFIRQGDLGLYWLGELHLDPIYQGVTVIFARGRPWLRAYGLTAHPNLLGAILAALLLLLLPSIVRSQGWQRILWYATFMVGLAGLVLTFSRGAGLGFLAGLLTWLLLRDWHSGDRSRPVPKISPLQPLVARYLKFILPLLLFIPLLWLYSDLFLSRLTHLDAPSEAQSLTQRVMDARLALHMIANNPLTGVGLGSYTDVAKVMKPEAARVHNVLLMVTAELGLPGMLLLLWLFLSPFA